MEFGAQESFWAAGDAGLSRIGACAFTLSAYSPWRAPPNGSSDGDGIFQEIGIGAAQIELEKTEQRFKNTRDRILDPMLMKRSFRTEEEFAAFFDLGSSSRAVGERLYKTGFLTKCGLGRIDLWRPDPVAIFHLISMRAKLDIFSVRVGLPRLSSEDLTQIELAGVRFSQGPTLVQVYQEALVIFSILHEAAERPLLSRMTQELHRRMMPFTYLDSDRKRFENLAPVYARFARLLRRGQIEKVCREISVIYQENARLTARLLNTSFAAHQESIAYA